MVLLFRRIVGDSMLPTLRAGSIIVASGLARKIQTDDIIIIRHEGAEKVKRVINVNIDKIYIEGDNKLRSTDSRHFGWLNSSDILGKVIWPKQTRNKFAKQKSPK
jgi:phage repressor protein C with HTH and peptisase S24 domain